MKRSLLLLGLLVLDGCKKPPPPPTPALNPSYVVREHRLAPPGTLYLVAYASKTTDSGVIGFKPGTKVALLKDNGDTIRVAGGMHEIEVPAEYLTNDLDLAALASRRDAQSQEQLSAALQRAYAENLSARDKQNALLDEQQKEAQERQRAANATHFGTSLSRGAYDEKKGVSRSPYIYSPYHRFYP